MANAVIAILKGGLGNQLFIYAAARALALRTGRRLYLDAKRGYTADGYGRSCKLDRFPIEAEPMPEAWRIAPTLRHPWHKLVRAFSRFLPRDRRGYIAEKRRCSSEQLLDLRPRRERVTLLGYWQNETYFAHQARPIRRELAPPAPRDKRNLELGEQLSAGGAAFVHVRRARYPELLPEAYYQGAIDAMRANVPGCTFCLFGDDLAWARERLNFRGGKVVEVAHNANDELADLWLMTRCKHAIMANSSFSWWGAWLGADGAGGVVRAPEGAGYGPRLPSRWMNR